MRIHERGHGLRGLWTPCWGSDCRGARSGGVLSIVRMFAARGVRGQSLSSLARVAWQGTTFRGMISADNETRTLTREAAAVETTPPWRVVVLNDPVNLMSYVVLVFKRVFGYPTERARKHMLEVHRLGRSVVWTGPRERAELYVHQLHQWKLSAILESEDTD